MPRPGEHKTAQARILEYAGAIGWNYVSRADAERRRGFDPEGGTPAEQAARASLCPTARCIVEYVNLTRGGMRRGRA